MMEPISTSQVIAHGAIAVFGAVVHALNAHRNGKSKTWLDFVILIVMSSFTGVIFTLLALHFIPTAPYLAYAASGAGGYIGVEGMSLVVSILKSKFK